MGPSDSTCWILIEGAAAGSRQDRESFARRYQPVIRAYLGARWRGAPHAAQIDDAVQEVFLECFRKGGVLERADPHRPGGFRAFLYAVARNVALRCETRAARRKERPPPSGVDLAGVESREEALSRVFDRAWARSLLREAFVFLERSAETGGELERRRVDLLRLHYEENLTIRAISARWNVDEKTLYREFARAKEEYRSALARVLSFHRPGAEADIERQCAELAAMMGAH
jgi:RNA polymerase sigma factor (sigma-70 family)